MESQDIPIIITSVIGFISLCRSLVPILSWVWAAFLRPPKNLKHYGSWAIITGSTDGIGKALAFELASKGLNLVLVGRNPVKLKDTCDGIREKYASTRVEVKCVVSDFSKDSGEEIVKKIQEAIHGLDVGVLVNNAGLGTARAKYFHEGESEMIENMMKVNIEGATWGTKAVLPSMMKKKKGAIVNIGSGSGSYNVVPSFPLYTVYASTKAYMEMLSRSLGVEYKRQGIDIQLQLPMFVATKMTSIRRSSFFIPSPETFSRASARWIGYENTCLPYWTHYVESCMLSILPDALLNSVILGRHLSIRERVMLKEKQEAVKNSKKP